MRWALTSAIMGHELWILPTWALQCRGKGDREQRSWCGRTQWLLALWHWLGTSKIKRKGKGMCFESGVFLGPSGFLLRASKWAPGRVRAQCQPLSPWGAGTLLFFPYLPIQSTNWTFGAVRVFSFLMGVIDWPSVAEWPFCSSLDSCGGFEKHDWIRPLGNVFTKALYVHSESSWITGLCR